MTIDEKPQSISRGGVQAENLIPPTYHTHNGADSPKVMMPAFDLTLKSVQVGITAATGSTQATGVQITKDIAEISVCANAGDAVTLPRAKAGLQILITNHGAASCDVFPAVGNAINEGAADAAKALAANATLLCYAYDSTNFECLTLAR